MNTLNRRILAAEIYHFEKYNLKLNDDFIAHVLSKTSE